MQNLEQLTLAENSFDGPIPAGLGRLAKISVISLTNNLLTGEIPSSFVNLFSISTMELDRNRLSGNIPAFLTGLRNLTNLIVQKQRPSAECLAFYGSAIQVPATSGLPSTTATSFVPSNTPTSPTTDKTTILVVSITTSLLLVFALTAITLYVVRRRRHSGIKPLFRFSSATSSVELEPRFSSHPIVVQPLNEKDEMARSTLFANLDVVENRGPLDDIASYAKSGLNGSGTGPASTIGWSSTLVKEAGRSMGSVGWSSSVATSSAGDSVTVGGEVDEKVVDRDFMAIDPEEWTRREVVLWLTRCGFRPEVIETFEGADAFYL
ncbi:hypothetical protein BC829DRAFT_446857 [Chytridium lagenaria]|nr:hypothetical protein BC829DRAFT_446857 [Chytridium lagenaria]